MPYAMKNLEVRGPDFMGHSITWTDPDGEGFRLELHMSDKPASRFDRQRWQYVLWDENWAAPLGQLQKAPIFSSDDFETIYAEDEEIVRTLLSFLSLRPGDTDSEYFDSYTERQIAWRDERAETLSMYAIDEEE